MTAMAWLAAMAALSSLGCSTFDGPKPQPVDPNPLADGCADGKPPEEPDLMGWQSGQRASLATLRQKGVVAVRYEARGCDVELQVLLNCKGAGSYEFAPYVANESKLASDLAELRAKLPIGALEIGGHLKAGWSVRTDYRLAGMLSLPVGKRYSRDDLEGLDCDRATHVVARIYVGGFALVVGESQSVAAEATFFGAGASGEHATKAERLASEGDAEGCAAAQRAGQESHLCAVPLRVGLLPLGTPIDPQDSAPDPQTGLPPLAVVDAHGCNQEWQVWDGTRCVSISEKPVACPEGEYFHTETKTCRACDPKILARGCP